MNEGGCKERKEKHKGVTCQYEEYKGSKKKQNQSDMIKLSLMFPVNTLIFRWYISYKLSCVLLLLGLHCKYIYIYISYPIRFISSTQLFIIISFM